MKQLKKDLKAVSKQLKQLSQMTEKMLKRLAKLEKAQAPKKLKPRAKTSNKIKKGSASRTVLAIIQRSRKGVDAATLVRKTSLEKRTVWAIVYRLKLEGKIKSGGYGLYVKA